MGTLVKITLYARDEDEARAAFHAAFSRIRELDDTLSDYKPGSELNRITAAAVGTAVGGSRDLIRVLAASQELAAATGGAFDITQGPVIRLWREARATRDVCRTSDALREASARSGYRKLHVDRGAATVRWTRRACAWTWARSARATLRARRSPSSRHAGIALRAGRRERRPRVQRCAPGRARLAHPASFRPRPRRERPAHRRADQRGGLDGRRQRAAPRRRRPPLLHIVDPATRTGPDRRPHRHRCRVARPRRRRPRYRHQRARRGERTGADRVAPGRGSSDRSTHARGRDVGHVLALSRARCFHRIWSLDSYGVRKSARR